MELDQGLNAVLARGERDRLAAVDVEVLRSRGQILQESESRFPARTGHLHAHAVAAAHLERRRADNEDRETVAARGHEEEPVLDARERSLALEVEGDVVHRAFRYATVWIARGEQIREGELLPTLIPDRDADEIRVSDLPLPH